MFSNEAKFGYSVKMFDNISIINLKSASLTAKGHNTKISNRVSRFCSLPLKAQPPKLTLVLQLSDIDNQSSCCFLCFPSTFSLNINFLDQSLKVG